MNPASNPLHLLRSDQRNIRALINRFEKSADAPERSAPCKAIIDELNLHSAIEEAASSARGGIEHT